MSEMNVHQFHKALRKEGYLCTQQFADKVYCALEKKPMSITMLIGQAGTGKSFLPETLGNVLKCNVYVKQAYQGMDWDEFVRKHVPDEHTKSGIKSIDAELLCAVQESQERRVVLLLDEWDKTRVSSDSYFLDFLQTGRLSVSGQKYQANLDNLLIFFTSNNERDISEPLLRRVKVIEVEHLPVSLVADVLKKRYKKNATAMSMIEPVLKLYHTSVNSKMDKPATIQELCDLINDWVMYKLQNREPNWEELVYVNVTKSERNHSALQDAIKNNIENKKKEEFNKDLDVEYFSTTVELDKELGVKEGIMPRMMELRNIKADIDYSDANDKSDVYVEIERNDGSYTTAYIEAKDGGENIEVPHMVGWNTIKPDVIQRSKPYPLSDVVDEWSKFKRMMYNDGVIVLTEPYADIDDVIGLIEHSHGFIRKGTDEEIIFRIYDNRKHEINGRWLRNKGCEIVCHARALETLRELIDGVSWYGSGSRCYVPLNRIQSSIRDGNIPPEKYVHLRSLGHTKSYLDVVVSGENNYNDDLPYHVSLMRSTEAKIKETSRTTTYNMGWAVVQSWHKKDKPNYKSHVVIKERPGPDCNFGLKLLRGKLNVTRVPLFINMEQSQFDKCDREVYSDVNSSRVLQNVEREGLKVYAINTFDRCTFMVESEDKNDLHLSFDFADALRTVRDKTLELIC